MSLPYTIGIFVLLVLPQSRAQAPAMVTTTSCRTYPLAPYSPATQVLVKPTTASPSLTSICATTTRPARVSLIAEPGVWANVFDHWGGCNQSIEFNFNDSWKKYDFGVTWYNDRAAGCTGTPTASMNCGIGINSALTSDETFKIGPTEPYATAYNPKQTGVGYVYCNPQNQTQP